MVDMTQPGFINSGLQTGLYQPATQVQSVSASSNVVNAQPLTEQVELSPQAKLLQQNEQLNQARQDSLFANPQDEKKSESEPNLDSVRISSSIGEAASSVGLTEQEAIKLYQSIKELL